MSACCLVELRPAMPEAFPESGNSIIDSVVIVMVPPPALMDAAVAFRTLKNPAGVPSIKWSADMVTLPLAVLIVAPLPHNGTA